MRAINIETGEKDFLIRIDKNLIDKDFLLELVDRIRFEYLIKKADFPEEIEKLGDEIKSAWWEKNKERIIGYTEE